MGTVEVFDQQVAIDALKTIARVDPDIVRATATIGDLEIDSLDFLEWIFALEEEMNMVIEEEILDDAGFTVETTIGEVVAHLAAKLGLSVG